MMTGVVARLHSVARCLYGITRRRRTERDDAGDFDHPPDEAARPWADAAAARRGGGVHEVLPLADRDGVSRAAAQPRPARAPGARAATDARRAHEPRGDPRAARTAARRGARPARAACARRAARVGAARALAR